ncbi:MAG TPA: TonB family protein [Terracidiphilus sp.]
MNSAVTRNDWVGRIIDGRFPLLELLGNSEQAGVFRTELDGDSHQRAVIRLVAAEDAEARLRDWKQAATLSHPHLMRIFDSGRADVGGVEVLYVVTEYAEESLAQVIPERPLSTVEAREMLVPVLDALAHLHSRGLVHGRIKPANIMVAGDRLKLPIESLRRAGAIPRPQRELQNYDAPELESGTILPASDVWSLGVTLAEALTQHAPSWDRATRRDPAVPAEIPEPFAAIVVACLRYDATRRATTAGIRALLNPSPSLQEPTNEMDLAAPAVNAMHEPADEAPNKTRMLAIGAAILVVLAVIVYAMMRSHPSQQPSHSAPPSAQAVQAPAQAVTPAPAPPPSDQKPQSSNGTVKGEVAERVMPEVSASANRSIHGKVDVAIRVNVSASGAVENARLEAGGRSRYFTAKALDAARRWRFTPAQKDGRDVASVWSVRFQFRRSGPEVHAVEVTP